MTQGNPFRDEIINAGVGAAEAALEFAHKFPRFPASGEVRVRFGPNAKSASVSIYDTEDLEYINRLEVNL